MRKPEGPRFRAPPTSLPKTESLQLPQSVQGRGRRWKGTWEKERVRAGEDNALQIGYGEFGVFSR